MSDPALPPRGPAPPRPLGFGELLDQVFRIYRRHFVLLASLALILSVPGLLVSLATGTASQLGLAFDMLRAPTPAPFAGLPSINPVSLGVAYLVSLLLVPFSIGLVPQGGLRLVDGDRPSPASIFQAVLRRYFGLFGLAVLLSVVGLTLVCFPVGLWLLVRFTVAVPVLLAERAGPWRALVRSWDLTEGGWWRTFGTLAVLYLIGAVVGGVLGLIGWPVALAVPFLPSAARGAIVISISTVSSALTLPLLSLAVVLLYTDFRVRREGYDLDRLAKAAALGATT